jgi:hypothetical protein
MRYRDMLRGLRERVQAEIAAGRTVEQVVALRLADAHGKETDFFPPDVFIRNLYRDLTRGRGERG